MDATDKSARKAAQPSRFGALVLCLGMFAAFYALLRLGGLLRPVALQAPAPMGAPPIWWSVDVTLTVNGFVDLAAAFALVLTYCAVRGRRFVDLGFKRPGTVVAWVLVLVVEGGLIALSTRGPLSLGKIPPTPYAIYASVFIGLAAAFAEETFFRGYIMEQLRGGGFGPFVQCLISMLLFGIAHYSYVSTGPSGWTIPVFTGMLGGFWSLIYLMGKRSLWPVIVAHVINDALVIPLAYYNIPSHRHG
jgi:membrane protease YdiL (CAAX protease family)